MQVRATEDNSMKSEYIQTENEIKDDFTQTENETKDEYTQTEIETERVLENGQVELENSTHEVNFNVVLNYFFLKNESLVLKIYDG